MRKTYFKGQRNIKRLNSINRNGGATLCGRVTKIFKFETLFALHFLSIVLGSYEQSIIALQSTSYTSIGVVYIYFLDDILKELMSRTTEMKYVIGKV